MNGSDPMREAGWMTTQEAADYLHINRHALARLARRGELASHDHPIDRRFRFYRIAELDRLRGARGLRPASPDDESRAG
jgi:excisionase family DNA binding protein